MICILLLRHVGFEAVVRDNKVRVKKLGDGVIDGGSPGKDSGVVHVEVGVDKVNIAIDGGHIDGQVCEVGAKGLGGRDTVDRGHLHDLLVDERTILHTVKGVLALVLDLEVSLGGRSE